ncbi:hypothetical protein ESA94_18220 [Lacibacter luteus]|uniref:DUF5977 domain-containing protein n=1 Tax=Lacibacter luteus TaxID=2508719 RepID=A0A4Q1CF87_9BACT|nr:hypothetical protein [Lacibacter luteus]RXK58568.1 hypothetical protein ESA94_18220 [Lacibacter luteus]
MKRVGIFIGLLLIISSNLSGQVHLQTGSAQYSYPLFKYSDESNGFGTTIELQYVSGSGVKVNEIADDVGLGWGLGAGGFIQRVQYGEPDDQDSRNLFPPITNNCTNPVGSFNQNIAYWDPVLVDIVQATMSVKPGAHDYINNYYPNGYMFSEFVLSPDITQTPNSCMLPGDLVFTPRFKSDHDKRIKYSRRALADRQQDVFTFNFNGRVGSFVIGRDHSITILPDSKLKIRFELTDMTSNNIRTKISSFIITDEYGIEFKFSTLNLTEVLNYINPINLYNTNANQTQISTNIYRATSTGKYIVDKWFLSEIKNPRTGAKIVFNYEDYYPDFIGSYNMACSFIQEQQYYGVYGTFSRSFTITENRIKGRSKRIREIVLPGNSKYQFVYGGQQRMDSGPKTTPLTEVKEYVENNLRKSFRFKYGYFYKKEILEFSNTTLYTMTQNQKRFLRLCLRSVQEISSEETSIVPPTTFEYYTGSESSDPLEIVPPFGSFSQDHWGYYTSINQDITENEYPTAANMNLLFMNRMQIGATFYPFGNYESRTPTYNYAALGILKSVTNPQQGKLTYVYEQNQGKTGMHVKNASSPLNYNQGVRVKKCITIDPVINSSQTVVEYSYTDDDGTSSGWGFEQTTEPFYTTTKQLYHYKDDGTYSYSANSMSGKSESFFQTYVFRDIMSSIDFASKAYSFYQTISATTKMSGPLLVADFVLFVGINLIQASNANATFTIVNSGFYPSSTISPLPIMYSRVKVKNVSANVNSGYTVHKFTSPATYNDQIPPMSFPYSPKMRFLPWKYGLPLITTHYDAQDKKVKEEENIYNQAAFERDLTTNTNNLSCYVETNAIVDYILHNSQGGGYTNYLSYSFYYPRTGRSEVSETKIRNYNSTGVFNETTLIYNYSPKNFQINEITTVKSDGQVSGERIYYPLDYEQNSVMQLCSTNNIINVPVCKVTWKKESSSSTEKKVVIASLTEYAVISNGDIKPIKVYHSELDEPTVSDILDPEQVKNNLLNYSFLKESKRITYTDEGDVLTVTSNGTISTSTLYDYSSSLPVAKIDNGNFEEGVAYTSFEGTKNHEAAGINKWGYGTHLIKSSQGAITGSMAYDLVGSMWINSLNSNKKYILSFWVKGPRPGVNINFPGGGNQIIDNQLTLVRSVNGWFLYQGEISGAEGIGIWKNNSNECLIDEVRVYPADSRMTTTTYNQRFGVSSVCDANNNILYYQYDAVGRLIAVRDIEKNIIKTYEYNYLKVGNDEISKTFTKSCLSYQLGSEVLYTVFANTHFGLTKEEANNLALNDLNTNGPAQANSSSSGTCTTVYARLELNYWNQSSSYGEADVVIRFYSDQNCTQPLYVTNHAVTYTEHIESYDSWGNLTNSSTESNVVATGTEYVIGTNVLMYDHGNYYGSFYRSYYINDKPNYLIAY